MAAFVILGSAAAVVTLSLFVVSFAPQGYEDETGFHFGPEQSPRPQDADVGALAGTEATA